MSLELAIIVGCSLIALADIVCGVILASIQISIEKQRANRR